MSSKFAEQSLHSFRVQVAYERRILDEASADAITLNRLGALDSFVEDFTDGNPDQLFGLLTDRLVHGAVSFFEQAGGGNGPLEYTDHYGCLYLFDPKKPELGWV